MNDKFREKLCSQDKENYDRADLLYQENVKRLAKIQLSLSDCQQHLAEQNEHTFIKTKKQFILNNDQNCIPNEIHYIWLGCELPFVYRLQILKCVLYNDHYHLNLWYCKELLTDEQAQFMQKFAADHGIKLHNILHYRFDNMDLILNSINEQQLARAADLIRIEDYFAGIYLDTDIDHHTPLPFFNDVNLINMSLGIQTSYENMQLGLSNSVLVTTYASEMIKRYRENVRYNMLNNQFAINPNDAYLTSNGEFHSSESAILEREVLSSTGPYVLSKVIEQLTGMEVMPKKNEDEHHYFLRMSPLFAMSLAGYFDVRQNDLTWVPEYRKIFNFMNYKQEQNKINAYHQLQNKIKSARAGGFSL